MGNNLSGLRFLACDDYARYVFNSMHCMSKCNNYQGGPCCELDMDTEMISVTESESEDAVRVCCI